MQRFMVLSLFLLMIVQTSAFTFISHPWLSHNSHSLNLKQFPKRLAPINSGNSLPVSDEIVIIGQAGGIAEELIIRLNQQGKKIIGVFPREPYTKQILKENRIIFNDFDKGVDSLPLASLAAGKTIVLCNDDGDSDLLKSSGITISPADKSKSITMIENVSKALPTNVKSIILASSAKLDTQVVGIFNKVPVSTASTLRQWSEKNGVPFSLLRYGYLIGGIRSFETTPFLGLPLLEPELHPSYILRSATLNNVEYSKYANEEICTRSTCVDGILQILQRKTAIETFITSTEGKPLEESDWDQLFARISTSNNSEMLRIQFSKLNRIDLFLNWLVDSWFPTALIESDSATILTGPRPVRMIKTSSNTVEIIWEDIQPDLSIKNIGSLEINLLEEANCLSVRRKANSFLANENQLIDKLVEGVNKNVYKKGFATAL